MAEYGREATEKFSKEVVSLAKDENFTLLTTSVTQ